jgi:hypothetical protein
MADIKVAILEKDGVELAYQQEYRLLAEDVPYNNGTSHLPAADVQAAIDALSVQTSPDNFSYKRLTGTKYILIPEYQQMLVLGDITLDDTSTLEILGELVLYPY